MALGKHLGAALLLVWTASARAQQSDTAAAGEVPKSGPQVMFSGYVDADFAGQFGMDGQQTELKDPRYYTGLEMDLTTTVQFGQNTWSQVYLTANDGVVPAQGAGRFWPPVYFDGAMVGWQPRPDWSFMAGDLITGTGYFNYYLHKRTAVVVPEHAIRGLGLETRGIRVHTGVFDDHSGPLGNPMGVNPMLRDQWGTYLSYTADLENGIRVTPALLYVGGAPGIKYTRGGILFQGDWGDYGVDASLSANSDTKNDLGMTILVEPRYTYDFFSVAAAFFWNEKGFDDKPSINIPRTTLRPGGGNPAQFDDLFFYVEPGASFLKHYAVGLPLEYHDVDLDSGPDETFWVVPTFYVYPAPGIEVWAWAQAIFPTNSDSDADPSYFFGSEIIVNF